MSALPYPAVCQYIKTRFLSITKTLSEETDSDKINKLSLIVMNKENKDPALLIRALEAINLDTPDSSLFHGSRLDDICHSLSDGDVEGEDVESFDTLTTANIVVKQADISGYNKQNATGWLIKVFNLFET